MSSNQPTLAFNLEHDLRALSAMASNLTPYLYEEELYGQISNDLPKLTLGGLLLRLYRLNHLENLLDADQQTVLQDARINFDAEVSKWAAHFETKLQHELQARITAYEQFLKECPEDMPACAANYPVQAELRAIIQHLIDAAVERHIPVDEMLTRLRQADQRLRQLFRDGDFIVSDERLEAAYPRDSFWWMYGYIPDERR